LLVLYLFSSYFLCLFSLYSFKTGHDRFHPRPSHLIAHNRNPFDSTQPTHPLKRRWVNQETHVNIHAHVISNIIQLYSEDIPKLVISVSVAKSICTNPNWWCI